MEQLLLCLRAHIHTPNRRQLAQELRGLQGQLRAQGLEPELLQGPLFAFPDEVKQVLRRRQIRPHWMFVLDSLLSRAVRAALAVLAPEVEEEAVLPKSEEASNAEESEPKQQETPAEPSPLLGEPEQGTPSLMVQLGLLRAETDRYSSGDLPIISAQALLLLPLHSVGFCLPTGFEMFWLRRKGNARPWCN